MGMQFLVDVGVGVIVVVVWRWVCWYVWMLAYSNGVGSRCVWESGRQVWGCTSEVPPCK